MNLTDEERQAIRAAVRAKRSQAPPPVPVVVTNHQPFPEPKEAPEFPDLAPALAGIAAAVEGVSGKPIAQAISRLAGVPEAIATLNTSVVQLTKAVASIKSADMSAVVEAVTSNTRALMLRRASISARTSDLVHAAISAGERATRGWRVGRPPRDIPAHGTREKAQESRAR